MSTAGSDTCWRPTASLESLKQAALLKRAIRQWMLDEQILEVCTPALSSAATTDPQVQSLVVDAVNGTQSDTEIRYLHTSPEFAMKRILCAYPDTDIYQLATVFRAEEQGRYHVSQFNMLEWYRIGMDHEALMQDVERLLRHLWKLLELDFPMVTKRSYCQEVFNRLGEWPDTISGSVIRNYFQQNNRSFPAGLEQDVSACLDLFMDEFVISTFDPAAVTLLCDYPGSQAALARVVTDNNGTKVASRFEVFVGQVELANGFHELSDSVVQRQRFENDLEVRKCIGKDAVPMDENLLAALQYGLPDCAGIALGIDRLQMILGGHQHIREVVCFSDDNA